MKGRPIGKQGEDMNFLPGLDFHPGNDPQPPLSRMVHDRGNVSGYVMIGDGNEVQLFFQGPLDDPPGREVQAGAGRKTGVNVQIGVIFL
jgi:hypothetical protein